MRRAAVRVETIPGPNYTPAQTSLVSRGEWALASAAWGLRRAAWRGRRRLERRLRSARGGPGD